MHNTVPGSSKLGDRSWPCLHLSFDAHVKGYQCYDPATNTVLMSKDVQFLENHRLHIPDLVSQTTSVDNNDITVQTSGPQLHPTHQPTLPSSSTPSLLSPSISALRDRTQSPLPPSYLPELSSPPKPSVSVTTPTAPSFVHSSSRIRVLPHSHDSYICIDLVDSFIGVIEEAGEQLTYAQARTDPRWISTMQFELHSIQKNHTWDLIPLPPGIHSSCN